MKTMILRLSILFLATLLALPGYAQTGVGFGGRDRGGFTITAERSTYAGSLSGQFITGTGKNDNTAFGYSTFRYAQFGNYNSAFGSEALAGSSATSSGYYNSAFGYRALKNFGVPGGAAGNYNSAFGYLSMHTPNQNVSGFGNSAFGANTLVNIETGNANSALGYLSLSIVKAGSYNIGIGMFSGASIFSGSNNIAIGYNAGTAIADTNNSIIIGGNSINFATDASNQLNIQNIIYGTGNSGTGTTVSTGNIGIGIASPNVKLDVNGGIAYRLTTNAQITASQNDYAIGAQSAFRISSNAAVSITGITGGFDGKLLIIRNIGAFAITFTNQDVLSTAVNRIAISTGANIAIGTNSTLTLQYDATTARWFDIALR